jgi:hypothetical protein
VTIPLIKIKVFPKPVLKGKMDVRFPANVVATNYITLTKIGGTYTFGINYAALSADLLVTALPVDQNITGAGPVAVNANSGTVRVNQTVGAAMTLVMPLASVKTSPVLISDWKGDAGTNNITITLTGSDKFPGNLTSWTIAADGGSVFLRPIGGVGYVL